ncbi:MAG: phage tail protein [Thermosynechococcaceae cyanobacterium]
MPATEKLVTSFGVDLGSGGDFPILGVRGLKTQVATSSHNTGNTLDGSFGNNPVPGPRKPENVTIEFALTDSREVFKWFDTVNPKGGKGRQYDVKDMTVYGYDEDMEPLMEIKLVGAYPIRWKLASVGAAEDGLLKEEVEFVITNIEKVK